MFGHKNTQAQDDRLPIFVHTMESSDAFTLADRVWAANARYRRHDPTNGKELLHFAYPHPACVVWLQKDQGRDNVYELILVWKGEQAGMSEVYIIEAALPGRTVGSDERAKQILNTILSTPSTVPSAAN